MPCLKVKQTAQFKKDLKKLRRQRRDVAELSTVVRLLQSCTPLPVRYRDHALAGEWRGYRECHIAPDWLLIYLIEDGILVLTLVRTGSHSEILGI